MTHMSAREMLNPPHSEIALRAYQIWEAEGRPPGSAVRHWLEAEAELAARLRTIAAGKSSQASRYGLVLQPGSATPGLR